MKLAMAQMRMTGSMDENLKTSLEMCDSAHGCDLLFFPEVELWRGKRPYISTRRKDMYL